MTTIKDISALAAQKLKGQGLADEEISKRLGSADAAALFGMAKGTAPYGVTPDGRYLDPITNQNVGTLEDVLKGFETPQVASGSDESTRVIQMIKDLASGNGLKYADAASPEVEKFKTEKAAALETEKSAVLKQYEFDETKDLSRVQEQGKQTLGMVKNKLAELGLLDNSTASLQYLKDTQDDINETENQAKAKYQIMRMNLDAKVKNTLLDAVNQQVEAINKRVKDRIDQMQKAAEIGVNVFKELSQSDIEKQKMTLEREKLAAQKAYNEGRLSIDEYEAKIKAVNSEIERYKTGVEEYKARSDAELGGYEAATNRMRVDIEGFKASTGRMKVMAEYGLGRPTYDEFVSGKEKELGSVIEDKNSASLKAEYQQKYPLTYRQATNLMTTEDKANVNMIQDAVGNPQNNALGQVLIDDAKKNGYSVLKAAQLMFPEYAGFLRGPGQFDLNDLLYGGLRYELGTPSEE